jgi:hypothetical protein
MQSNKTVTLSFRIHPNTKTWLSAASEELSGHIPALLRMMFLKAAWEQPESTGGLLGRLFGNGNRRQPTIGNTVVISVRLPIGEATVIKNAAIRKNMGVSEWAGNVIHDWFPTFKPFYDKREDDPTGWLTDYTSLFVQKFNQAATVYAQKTNQESEKTVVGRGS